MGVLMGWSGSGRRAALALLVLLLVPTGATSQQPARDGPAVVGKWQKVRGRPGPVPHLIDARSPVITYGIHVPLGQARDIGGHVLTFTRDRRGRLALSRKPPGRRGPRQQTFDVLPSLHEFDAFDGKYAIVVRKGPDDETVELAAGWGLPIEAGGGVGWLLDADLDGTIGSKGDGFVGHESRTVGPFTGEIWTEGAARAVRPGAEGGFETAKIAMPHPENDDHARAWRLMQWRRQQCGLLPVRYKESLEVGLRAHADYCVENDYRGHDEQPDHPAYSEGGARAGHESAFGYAKKSAVAGMQEQLETLYHRDDMLDPALTATAFVLHRGVFGLNFRDSVGGRFRHAVLVYPPHGMENVPPAFNRTGEIPMPVPKMKAVGNTLGFPIGVYAFPLLYVESLPRPPEFTVVPLSRRGVPGKPVEGHLYYPGHHPGTGTARSNNGEVSFTPARTLSRSVIYRCRVEAELPSIRFPGGGKVFRYEWEFTVGD